MHQRLIFLLIFALVISCIEKEETVDATPLPNRIVLLFDHPPVNHKYTFEGGMYTLNACNCEISFFDDQGHLQNYALAYGNEDTLIITSRRKTVEIGHAYKAMDVLYYQFQNGDTVLFSYDGLKPIAKILNRSVSEFALNYDLNKRKILDKNDFPNLIKFNAPFFFSGSDVQSDNFVFDMDIYQRKMVEEAQGKYEKENVLLDSLIAIGQVSAAEKKHKLSKSAIDLKIMQLRLELGNRPKQSLQRELTAADFYFENDAMLGENTNSLLSGDSAYYFHGNYQILDFLFYSYFNRKADRITSTLIENGQAQAGSNMPDYTQVYDSIYNSHLIDGRAKDYLLIKSVESIMDQSPYDLRMRYFEKFKSDVKDTAMIDFLTSKYQMTDDAGYDMLLISMMGDTTTYDELIKSRLGKAIYLDFWASWCGPCIKEMPASKELRAKYPAQKMEFLYISSDIDIERWRTACEKHELDESSYLIINTYTSRQWDEMGVSYIPRYFLFDRNGLIINNYAPRPSDKKLAALLDKSILEL